jgi:heat-inducible transcriptional repressor
MLITDSGRVQQVMIESEGAIDAELVQEIRGRLNGMLAGSQLAEVKGSLGDLASQFAPHRREFTQKVISRLMDLVDANKQEKLVVSGASNLVRQDGDFSGELSKVLEAIEEQVVLLRLLDELHTDTHGVGLRIGSELGMQGLQNTSLVFTGYQSRGTEVAKLGVLGPTRMDYSNNIASVRAVARYLSKALEDN